MVGVSWRHRHCLAGGGWEGKFGQKTRSFFSSLLQRLCTLQKANILLVLPRKLEDHFPTYLGGDFRSMFQRFFEFLPLKMEGYDPIRGTDCFFNLDSKKKHLT